MELSKGHGERTHIKPYRDITLSDLSSKDFGSFIPAAVLVAVSNLAGEGQYGAGLNGGTTDLCHLHVTQAFCTARAQKRSCGIVFIDIVGAFASVARRIVVPDLPQSEEVWRVHLTACGFTPDDGDSIVSQPFTVL